MRALILIIILIIVSFSVTAALTDDILVWYEMDVGEYTTDSSGNNKALTNTNAIEQSDATSGYYNCSKTTSHLKMPLSTYNSSMLTGEMSWSFWYLMGDGTENNAEYFGVRDWSVANDHFSPLTSREADGFWASMYIRDSSGDDYNSGVYTTGVSDANNTEWHHIVGIWDGSIPEFQLFLDGVNVSKSPVSSNIIDSFGAFASGDETFICGTNDADSGTLQGQINISVDEFGMWKRKINPAEVTTLYNSGVRYSPYFVEPLTINTTSYNMTSDGGCLAWRTNTSNPCNTTDGTPTITFSTNKAANCSIRTQEHNYSASYQCGTGFASNHICTLTSEDQLSFGLSNLYLNCTDGSTYADSGALAINMTAGGGGAGLVSCISVIGTGCGVSIENNCAIIVQT